MKRYSMGFFKGAPAMFAQPNGDYVKWSEVERYLVGLHNEQIGSPTEHNYFLCAARRLADSVDGVEWLDNVEAELRKVPGLTEKDIMVLTAMASAGFDYADALKRRRAHASSGDAK